MALDIDRSPKENEIPLVTSRRLGYAESQTLAGQPARAGHTPAHPGSTSQFFLGGIFPKKQRTSGSGFQRVAASSRRTRKPIRAEAAIAYAARCFGQAPGAFTGPVRRRAVRCGENFLQQRHSERTLKPTARKGRRGAEAFKRIRNCVHEALRLDGFRRLVQASARPSWKTPPDARAVRRVQEPPAGRSAGVVCGRCGGSVEPPEPFCSACYAFFREGWKS